MKTICSGRAWCLAVGVLVTVKPAFAADTVASPASTNLVASTRIEAPRLGDATPAAAPVTSGTPTLTLAPEVSPAPKAEPGAGEALEVIASSASVDTLRSPEAKPQEAVQRRLEAPSPEKLIERHGALGFLARQPEPRNFLDIINPFAPVSFGPQTREIYSRNPNLKAGAVLPRTFVNDVTHEPDLNLFNWPW